MGIVVAARKRSSVERSKWRRRVVASVRCSGVSFEAGGRVCADVEAVDKGAMVCCEGGGEVPGCVEAIRSC